MARVFITGSSDGLGLLAARLLAQGGHKVVLHARSDTRAADARVALPEAEAVVIGDLSTVAAMRSVADQVNALGRFCADVTYLPMRRGFLYLVAIMDWASRKVLAWKLSNTLDVDFCVEALEAALARYGRPEIFNTDQGSQFTGTAFTGVLKDAGIRISMDGRGRWMDNVFIERLWRSVKYECVYLHAFETGSALRAGIGQWVGYYNSSRPHSALAGQTPDEAYHRAAMTQHLKLAA